jgi:peptidoglycan hydrolase CwlO-like protein
MAGMSEPPSVPLAPPPGATALHRPFSRRSLLLAALAGTALAATGCTTSTADDADAVTPAQVDQLAAQVQVQEAVVAAYARASAAAPDLAAAVPALADQARAQLDRLRAAAPGAAASSAASSSAGPVLDPAGARAYLQAEVTAAADAHAGVCPDFSGGRAALLGSIAAGLRGQATQLAA